MLALFEKKGNIHFTSKHAGHLYIKCFSDPIESETYNITDTIWNDGNSTRWSGSYTTGTDSGNTYITGTSNTQAYITPTSSITLPNKFKMLFKYKRTDSAYSRIVIVQNSNIAIYFTYNTSNGNFMIAKYENGSESYLANITDGSGYSLNNWYDVELVYNDGALSFKMNGKTLTANASITPNSIMLHLKQYNLISGFKIMPL